MAHHILLIDDDIDELDFFQLAQKDMPGLFTYSYLNTAVEAIKTILKVKPDVVFLDINMPGMNGLQCLAEIKDSGKCVDVPVILYSTAIDDKTGKKALALGAKGLVQKPILVNAFQKMLKDVLAGL